MGFFTDLLGTTSNFLKIGLTGVRLKNNSGNLAVRNNGDSADASITASAVNISGDTAIVINSDAAGSGADWSITLARPASGMSAAYTLTLPVDDGSPSQVLQTDGSGALSWVSAGTTADCVKTDSTTLAFNSSTPVAMFTLPANAVVLEVEMIVDTAFNGTAPTATVGISGNTSKYMGASANDLKGTAKDSYITHPGEPASGSTESLIITYSADSSSAGSARFLVRYTIPS